ncbi:MAG: hypothetical protein M3388_17805 [Acidobacteriota bacterium]|nr:hypothetical protein [Acidobacteriota bacterium]
MNCWSGKTPDSTTANLWRAISANKLKPFNQMTFVRALPSSDARRRAEENRRRRGQRLRRSVGGKRSKLSKTLIDGGAQATPIGGGA